MSLPPAYQAALDYIYNYVDYERRRTVAYTEVAWDLDRTRRVLAALGDPHLRFRIVHVAGSKGKGSTAAGIEAILRAAGLRTGFYTSPHLHTFRERIRVNGELISRAEVVALLEQCKPAIEAVPGITTFEIMTVLAMMHFVARNVQWAVLEVGLGGRLDSTNVVVPDVCVITRISLEHTALLGNTLDEIAREKAGIIKNGVPVVVAPQPAEALAAIVSVAADRRAPLIHVGSDWRWASVSASLAGQVFTVWGNPGRAAQFTPAAATQPLSSVFNGLTTPLLGAHQLANQTTAVAACVELARQGVAIAEETIRRGLAAVYWPGRLEVLQAGDAENAAVLVDSAHTVESAHLLCDALEQFFPDRRLAVILGVSNDKDVRAILSAFAARGATLFLTRSRHPRALDPHDLANLAAELPGVGDWSIHESVPQALTSALNGVDRGGTVLCFTGSLFVAAEGRDAWLKLYPDAFPAGDWAHTAEPMDPEWQVSQSPDPLERKTHLVPHLNNESELLAKDPTSFNVGRSV